MQQGYILLYRSMLDKGWSKRPDYVAVWVYLLLRGGYVEKEYHTKGGQKIDLKPGQFITSRKRISEETGVNESKIQRILSCFENEQQIEQQSSKNFRLISITNWSKYQCCEQQNEQQVNNKRTTSEQQVNTINKRKEGKERKEYKTLSSSVDEDQEFYLTKRKKKLSGKRLETFNQFWEAFNYKTGKAEAADSWLDIPLLTDKILDQIIESAKTEATNRQQIISSGKTPKMAQGWLTARRWEDEPLRVLDIKPELTFTEKFEMGLIK